MAQKIYEEDIKDKEFENPFTKEKHKIGVISVSGGHRTPKGKLEEFWHKHIFMQRFITYLCR